MSRMTECVDTGGHVHGRVRRSIALGLAGPRDLGLAGRVPGAMSCRFPPGTLSDWDTQLLPPHQGLAHTLSSFSDLDVANSLGPAETRLILS